jgi:hypothetical protein
MLLSDDHPTEAQPVNTKLGLEILLPRRRPVKGDEHPNPPPKTVIDTEPELGPFDLIIVDHRDRVGANTLREIVDALGSDSGTNLSPH